jgi:ribosomal protein L37E
MRETHAYKRKKGPLPWKKETKNFCACAGINRRIRTPAWSDANEQKFFVLFFKKEHTFFLIR